MLLRPAQVTLGSLVLAAKSDCTAYGALSAEAFTEQGEAVAAIERALAGFVRFERINYLMLMMVDPNVHFHVIPRYDGKRSWDGERFSGHRLARAAGLEVGDRPVRGADRTACRGNFG